MSQKTPVSAEGTKGEMMPVHIILGAAEYQRIQTTEPRVLVSNPDEYSGAEFTKFGWTMYGQCAGTEFPVEKNSSCSLEPMSLQNCATSHTWGY